MLQSDTSFPLRYPNISCPTAAKIKSSQEHIDDIFPFVFGVTKRRLSLAH